MRIPPGVRRAFRLPTTRERVARELDDEVRFHVEMRAQSLIERGIPRDVAYREALQRFGDVDDLRDYCVSIEVAHMHRMQFRERLSTLGQDFRFALRQFRKAPGFTFVAALTLALGVGATTAIFSVVNGVVLRPLPFESSEQMVQIIGIDAKGQSLTAMADPTFDAVSLGTRAFSALAEYQATQLSVVANGEPRGVKAALVSRQFFDVLRVRPIAGRVFAPEEQQVGASPAVVISHALWQRQFGGAPSAIGSKLMLGTDPATIVGVLPPGREFPAETEIYLPRELRGRNTSYTAHNWRVIGRVRDGVSLARANGDLSSTLRTLHASVGEATWTVDGKAVTIREQLVGKIRPLLLMLFGASGVLLLIACANVANLLIARMASREGEIAVRLAIGAGRGRLAQQLLIESSLLTAAGCAGGLLLAFGGMKILLALRPTLVPRVTELSVDGRVLAFAVLVSAATAIGLGLLAAWRGVRGDLRSALAQAQRTQGGGGASYRLRGSLVVVQVAMTVVLLIAAGLLGRSFIRLMTIDAGFRTKGLVIAELAFERRDGESGIDARAVQQQDEMLSRARALPGVTAAGISGAPPFSGGSSNGTFLILDNADVKLQMSDFERLFRDKTHTGYASYNLADGAYFRALDIPVLKGRVFDDRDRAGAPHVAVINDALAKARWPNENPIGKVIEFGNIDGDMTPITVVGVVADVRERDLTAAPQPAVYVSHRQRPGNGSSRYLVLATTTEGPVIASARQVLRQIRPDLPMRFMTIEEIIARSVASQRFMVLLVGIFGAAALLLATLGVYSVISYLVAQRGKEISIRVALGARGADILRLVIRQGLTLAVIGAVVGAITAFVTTRVLTKLLYDVSATDPLSFGAVVGLLCVVAAVASYVPARRAARLAPMDVLRAG